MSCKTITGITWDHSRALPPLVASAQRYEETHPGVRIRWEKRSLHEFGHMPVDVLAERFDLIVIDHPWAGFAFARGLFLDLLPMLSPDIRADLENHSIGQSYASYLYEGRLLAIPIDAATPTPSFRRDLLERSGFLLPECWSDVVALAKRGMVVMPGFPADLYLNFHMLCHALGGRLFETRERLVDSDSGLAALEMLCELASHMPDDIFGWNPIRIAEILSTTERFAYCPFAYSYGNYSRPHFAPRALSYGRLVRLDDGRPLCSVLGGTGIAISARCPEREIALDYALFTGSATVQRGIYTLAGGQPSRREAWSDPELDRTCGGFFSAARHDQERGIVRPRYDGYVPLQEQAGEPLVRHLRGRLDATDALDLMDAAYQSSLPTGYSVPTL